MKTYTAYAFSKGKMFCLGQDEQLEQLKKKAFSVVDKIDILETVNGEEKWIETNLKNNS